MRLVWYVGLSLLATMLAEAACLPGIDRRRYCKFTPKAREVMLRWVQKRGLEPYFTRENLTVITNAHLGTAGKLADIDKIIMKVPAAVWYKYCSQLLRKSACSIVGQTLSGVGLGAIAGFAGAGAVKWPEFNLMDALRGATAGAISLGIHTAAYSVHNALKEAEIGCIDYREPLKSRVSSNESEMVTLELRGLILHTFMSCGNNNDCVRISTSDDKDRLFLSYTDTATRLGLRFPTANHDT